MLEIEKFGGKEDESPLKFITNFEEAVAANNTNPQHWCRFFCNHLTDKARKWYIQNKDEKFMGNYIKLKEAFLKRFATVRYRFNLKQKLMTITLEEVILVSLLIVGLIVMMKSIHHYRWKISCINLKRVAKFMVVISQHQDQKQ